MDKNGLVGIETTMKIKGDALRVKQAGENVQRVGLHLVTHRRMIGTGHFLRMHTC